MYEVQQVFTYEWVTISTHDLWEEAEEVVIEHMDGERPDTIRIVEV